MSFRPVFSLHLIHPYYSDGVCPDFLIEPTNDTQRRLRNHRCVLKSGTNWIRVLMEPDLIPLEQGELFVFHLRLRDPEFALFTDLRQTSPLYTNEGLSSEDAAAGKPLMLRATPIRHRERFVVTNPVADDHFKLRLRPTTQAAFQVDGLTSTCTYQEAANSVACDTRSAKPGTEFTLEYSIQPPLYRIQPPAHPDAYRLEPPLFPDIFADVKIGVNGPWKERHQETGLGEFQIEFQPKQVRWIYYLVTNLKEAADKYHIEDKDLAGIRFTATDLNSRPDPDPDEVADLLERQHGDMKRIRFVSDEPVACRQAPKKNIQLRLGADLASGSVLAAALPNPSLGNFSTTVKQGTEQDSLFQIYRYVTHSFSPTGAT